MAISAVSPISAGGIARLVRNPLAGVKDTSALRPVQAIVRTGRREDAEPSREPADEDSRKRLVAQDPRGPASMLSGRAPETAAREGPKPDQSRSSDRAEASKRLDELLGQKAAIERRQADQKARSSEAVASELAQLKARDTHVRAHEAAHMAAGGRYVTGGASYTYEKGPDGAEYAIGGEVGIDTSPVPGKPEETVEKMRTIRAAALAPSDPSAADISVAASASEIEAEALAQIAQSRAEEIAGRYASAAGRSQDAKASGGGGPDSKRHVDMVA